MDLDRYLVETSTNVSLPEVVGWSWVCGSVGDIVLSVWYLESQGSEPGYRLVSKQSYILYFLAGPKSRWYIERLYSDTMWRAAGGNVADKSAI